MVWKEERREKFEIQPWRGGLRKIIAGKVRKPEVFVQALESLTGDSAYGNHLCRVLPH
jgi:hypothetical protein